MQKKINVELIIIFTSLCLYFSAIEYVIPKPFPFMKLGLANLPILLSLPILNFFEYFLLVVLKVLMQAVLSGTLFSYVFLFSFAGSFASGISMYFLYKIFKNNKNVSFLGISLCGAMFNNIAQLGVSRIVLFGENTRYIAPVLLITGFVTGIALGIVAVITEYKSAWYEDLKNKALNVEFYTQEDGCVKIVKKKSIHSLYTVWIIIELFTLIICILTNKVWLKWLCVLFTFVIAEINRHGKVKIIPPLLVVFMLVFFSLISPYGKILFYIGSWKITLGALIRGLSKASHLLIMLFISQSLINKNLNLHGKLGKIFSTIMVYFEELCSTKIKFYKGNLIKNIDNRLYEVWGKNE